MCTVSWSASSHGYDLLFNRDELHTRAPELAPEAAVHAGVTFLAPRDGAHGGTWLLVNDHGLTICLLNDYGASWQPARESTRFSRGHIVLAGAEAATHAHLIEIINFQPLARTPAFQLLALSAEEGAIVLRWAGGTLTQLAAGPPLSSSSYATAAVIATRTRRFHDLVPSGSSPEFGDLLAYHRQQDNTDGAYSVLMCRPDAATRSITHVTVHSGSVTMRYEAVRWARQSAVFLEPVVRMLPRRTRATLPAGTR